MSVSVGVDVGGTFTDVVVRDDVGRMHIGKVLTTPEDPRRAVCRGISEVLQRAGIAPGEVDRVVHGTTLATNVVLQRDGARVAFVTTAGFGDMLRLGREARVEEDRYDLMFTKPAPPVDHRFTLEVDERVAADGTVVTALSTSSVERLMDHLDRLQPEAIAICLVNAHVNDTHERLIAEACRRRSSGRFIAASSEVWPEMREFDRAMTTVMSAYVGPRLADYLAGLESDLVGIGLRCPVDIMESSGGVIGAQRAAARPIYTVESGGAAGVSAAGAIGKSAGVADVISFDMGGTTAKAGVLRNGRADITHDFQLGGKGSYGSVRAGTGFPLKIPVVDLAEVGAGGGSVAWIDAGGVLRVGPRSSGAVPGPACYGQGGTLPTVTDANLVLGYLDAERIADGVRLDRSAAERAVESVARPLGLDVVEAARAIHEVANAGMATAIWVVTIQRRDRSTSVCPGRVRWCRAIARRASGRFVRDRNRHHPRAGRCRLRHRTVGCAAHGSQRPGLPLGAGLGGQRIESSLCCRSSRRTWQPTCRWPMVRSRFGSTARPTSVTSDRRTSSPLTSPTPRSPWGSSRLISEDGISRSTASRWTRHSNWCSCASPSHGCTPRGSILRSARTGVTALRRSALATHGSRRKA